MGQQQTSGPHLTNGTATNQRITLEEWDSYKNQRNILEKWDSYNPDDNT